MPDIFVLSYTVIHIVGVIVVGLADEILDDNRDLHSLTARLHTNQLYLNLDLQKQLSMSQAITQQMIDDSMELLRLFGVPFIVSPSEAEAQCAKLEQLDLCDGTITEDSDVWLFGSRRVLKNFFQQDRSVTSFSALDIRKAFGLDREKLIALALVCGSDYTDGILGAGPVTAIEIISEFGQNDLDGVSALQKFKTWADEVKSNNGILPASASNSIIRSKLCKHVGSIPDNFPNRVVVDAYLEPRVDNSNESFEWGRADLDLLRKFAHKTLNWPTQKVDDLVCPVIKRLNSTETQPKISSFFNVHSTSINNSAEFQSKRLKSAISKLVTAQNGETPILDVPVVSSETVKTIANRNTVQKQKTKSAIAKKRQPKRIPKGKSTKPPIANASFRLVQAEVCLSEDSDEGNS